MSNILIRKVVSNTKMDYIYVCHVNNGCYYKSIYDLTNEEFDFSKYNFYFTPSQSEQTAWVMYYTSGGASHSLYAGYGQYTLMNDAIGYVRWDVSATGGIGVWKLPLWTPPNMKFKINNFIKSYSDGWVKVNGGLKKIDGIWAKVNDSLKKI